MNTEKTRIAGLDLMKALGLYLVVLYHLTFRNPPDVLSGRPSPILVYCLSTFMSICVPLFFTASGALSLRRPMHLERNLLRCAHLALLTVAWTAASLLIVLALRGERHSLRELWSIASSLSVGYIQHLWYLPTFLFLTLLMPVLYSLRSGSQRLYRYGLCLLVLFTFGNLLLNDLEYLLRWLLGRTGHTGTRQFFWYVNFFGYHYWYSLAYLALGAYLCDHHRELVKYRRAAVGAIFLCLLMLTLFALARCQVRQTVFDPVFNNYGDPFTLVLTGAVSLLLLTCRPGKGLQQVAQSLSTCSLGIYLLHWLFIEALLDYWPALVSTTSLAPLTALVVLAISWGLTWLLLRVPLLRNFFTAAPDWLHRLVK